MTKLIAWRLIGPKSLLQARFNEPNDVWTVSNFSDKNLWGSWSLAEALEHLNRDCGDGFEAECRVIAWPANEVLDSSPAARGLDL